MEIFLDLDGVIVDFDTGFIKWFKLDIEKYQINHWWALLDAYKDKYGQDKTEAEMWLALNEEFWKNLSFTPEAKKVLSLVDPYKPIIITSPPMSYPHNGGTGKLQWIEKNLPNYYHEGRYFITTMKSHLDSIRLLARNGGILIDDNDKHCINWQLAGGKAILFPRPWNINRVIQDPVHYLNRELLSYIRGDK